MLVAVQNGMRVAVPVGAPLVYHEPEGEEVFSGGEEEEDADLQMIGGSAVELADSIVTSIQTKLSLPDEYLGNIVGKCRLIYVGRNYLSIDV